MKRVKESGASFTKKKESQGRRAEKNEGAILKFVNISLQSSLSSANEKDEVSSFSKYLPHMETEKTVELEQSNQEVIIESIPTSETLIAKNKIDDINRGSATPGTRANHGTRGDFIRHAAP